MISALVINGHGLPDTNAMLHLTRNWVGKTEVRFYRIL